MAGIFRDGFDLHNGVGASPGMQSLWTSTSAGFGDLVAGRFGGQAWQSFNNASDASASITATMASAQASVTVHGSFRIDISGDSGVHRHLGLLSGSTNMCGIHFGPSGVISAYRYTASNAGTLLGSSAGANYTVGTWHSFALEVVISDTVGRMTLYVDDPTTPVLNLTSADTRNGSPTTVDTIAITQWLGTTAAIKWTIDDLYVTDSATKLSYFPRIETVYPTSDGSTLNFTPSTGSSHFAVVDEAQASATDYLSGSSVGDVDELGLGDLSSTPSNIAEIGVIGYVHRTDATARSVALGVKSGATTSDGSNIVLTGTIARLSRTLATDPNTSAAWTTSGVNALQARPKVTV